SEPKFVAPKKQEIDSTMKEFLKKQMNELVGTRAASIFDGEKQFAGRVPVKELTKAIKQVQNPSFVVVDADADKEIIMAAESAGVSYLVTTKKAIDTSRKIKILAAEDLK
ncbi:MAG: hypothetical protein KAT91_01875, partial [Candidatus Aenigmarchaeota archaeon]|nr:hypothetical protein [Candidatus Aenigmarchaeota archaeon]